MIAADPPVLRAAHPTLTGVLGPWIAGATLSNKGEKITLSRPDPAVPGALVVVDEVTYADEGDWAGQDTGRNVRRLELDQPGQ